MSALMTALAPSEPQRCGVCRRWRRTRGKRFGFCAAPLSAKPYWNEPPHPLAEGAPAAPYVETHERAHGGECAAFVRRSA